MGFCMAVKIEYEEGGETRILARRKTAASAIYESSGVQRLSNSPDCRMFEESERSNLQSEELVCCKIRNGTETLVIISSSGSVLRPWKTPRDDDVYSWRIPGRRTNEEVYTIT